MHVLKTVFAKTGQDPDCLDVDGLSEPGAERECWKVLFGVPLSSFDTISFKSLFSAIPSYFTAKKTFVQRVTVNFVMGKAR